MTRPARALLGLAIVLAAIAGGAIWWLRGDHARLGPVEERATQSDAARGDAAVASADAPSAERAKLEREAKPPRTDGPPESYRRALGAFRGRLLEPDRQPVVGLEVSAVEFEPSRYLLEDDVLLDEKHAPPPLQSARTLTKEDGAFLLEGLEPRAVHLLGIDLGGPRSAFRVIDVSPISGEVVDLGDIVLEPFVTFLGRVVDEESRPVAGARVRATNLPSAFLTIGIDLGVGDIRRGCGVMVEITDQPKAFEVPSALWDLERLLPIPTTLTDEEGKFRLPGVPLGMVTVIADKAGFKAASKISPSGKGPERDVGELHLTVGFGIDGVVVNGAEQVVAGVEVLAGIKSNALPVPVALLHPAGRTDEAGTFHLQGLPAGSDAYVATRTSRGQPWNVHGPFKTEAMPLRVQLSKPSGLLVRLHDEAGKPLADAELFIAPDPLEGGAPLPPIFAPPMQKLTEVSDVELGTKRVAGLDFGKYRLIGRAAGFALAQATVDVVDPPREYELLFQSANVLEVHVVRAKDREPLEWAFASLCPEGMFERPIARGRTDDEGRVDLARIPAGKYVLTVQHPAQATQEMKVEVPSPPVTVALPLGGHLKGRASDRGQDPGKSLFLILTQKDVKRPDAAMPTFSATAETGDFAVANLEAATYHYEFRDRIVGKGPLALIETMRDDPLAKGEVEIREGETTQLDVDVSGLTGGPVAELFGTVWINGVPTPDLSIRVEGPRNVTVKSDERGAWRFDAVPAGKSVLTVQALKENGDLFQFASALHREEIELTAGESRRIDLTLEIAAVRGRVTGPGPLPAGLGTNVILRDPASNLMLFTAPNPLTGSYEFASVPRGTYELLVRKPGAAPFTTTVVVDPTHGDVVCDAELVGSIRVSGRIVLPKDATPQADGRKTTFNDLNGGTQVVSGWIILVDTEGRPAGRGRVDWDALTFSIDDCAPGNYSAQLFGRDPALVSHGVVIPRGGSSDLVLAFEKPKEGETLINPLAGPSRRLRGN